MKKIRVDLNERSYNIIVGRDLIPDISSFVRHDILANPILIISNKKVNSLFGWKLSRTLRKTSPIVKAREIPDTEKAKSFGVYSSILRDLALLGKKTKPTIVVLGGGVAGDVAGFAAATYRRGIPYIQIPTSLLAQVDSSIGGKVAVDLPQAKNLIGSFYQPALVLADMDFLMTLPENEISNGMAEVIKYGVIKDAELFRYIENHIDKIKNKDEAALEHIVHKCASIKAGLVAADERDDKGKRIILNFGHTIGHAIEALSGYSKSYSHGQAVAIGMAIESKIAERLGLLKKDECSRIKDVIRSFGHDISFRRGDYRSILKPIDLDKKFVKGKNIFALPVKIGRAGPVNVPDKILNEVLKKECAYGQTI